MVTPKLTRTSVRAQLRAAGIVLHYDAEWNEYRVNFRGAGKDDTAYFTDDLEDALHTGLQIAKWRATYD